MWRTLTSKGINRMKTWDSKRGKKGARRGNRIRKPLLLLPPHHSSANSTQLLLLQTSLSPLGKHFSLWIETETWFKKRREEKVWKASLFFSTFWRLWKLEILTFLLVPWDDCSIHASLQRSKVFRDCQKPAMAKMRMCKQSGTVEEAQYVGVWKCRGVWEYVYSM